MISFRSQSKHHLGWILKATGITGFVILGGRIVAVLRESLVAARIGPSPELDALLLAYAIPLFIITALQNTLGSTWTPGFTLAKDKKNKLRMQIGHAQACTIAVSTIIAILFSLLFHLIIPHISSGVPKELHGKLIGIGYLFTLLIPIQAISFVFAAVLQSQAKYVIAALIPIVTPTIGVLALTFKINADIETLAYSLIIGGAIEAFLFFLVLYYNSLIVKPSFRKLWKDQIFISRSLFLYGIGGIIIGTIPLAGQLIASATGPQGVAHFAFASKVTSLFAGVAALALSQALLPSFSELSTDPLRFNRRVCQIFWIVFGCAAIASLSVILFNQITITILFGRGAFTSNDITIVAKAQAAYVMELPFYLCWLVICRATAAKGDAQFTIKSATAISATNILLSFLLFEKHGVLGICLSATISFILGFLMALYYVYIKRIFCI